MGLSLIALSSALLPLALTMAELPGTILIILEVAFALGAVIFVHELGHFAVAKWCGVKCEKFYLGFDIYGLKLFKYQYGETEYGIGILPLGGYVKMLGQDDNPSHAAQQREQSTVNPESSDAVQKRTAEGTTVSLDPRSYMAKSVPQRMAIISAGVIMNVIFAFIFAVVAYSMGVPEIVCGISGVVPGEPAWRASLQPGDRILAIEGYHGPVRFRDLRSAVALTDVTKGVDFTIKREGVEEPFRVNLKPDTAEGRLVPTVGVLSPSTTQLERNPIVGGGTPAAETGKFKVGDKITAVDGTPVKTYAELLAQLTTQADKPLTFTVERKNTEQPDESDAVTMLNITVPPRPMQTLGLAMTIGEITAIQDKSPAAEAGLRPGDLIETVDGEAPGDPLQLPELLEKRAGEKVILGIRRQISEGKKTETLEKELTLRKRPWPERSLFPGSPASVPALGLTYKVLARIQKIGPEGPAAKAKVTKDDEPAGALAAGDEIVSADFVLPELSEEQKKAHEEDPSIAWPSVGEPIKFSDKMANWPMFFTTLQMLPPDTKVTVTLADGRTATLAPTPAADWYYYDRGFRFGAEMAVVKADSFQDAVVLGGRETKDALLMVYQFLRRIGTQVSPFALGGPVTIVKAAGGEASEGIPRLLLFLTMLSANLAVINFLPIPLLDGGHMVFLILEGIMRRPVSEKVVVAFHYLGFIFIISLMMFVLGLDVGLIPRF